jgi:peptide/nickel transport system substrate-binding protein
MNTWVERAYAETKYTVVVELKSPYPKFHSFSSTWGGITGTYIMPKHIFENVENPVSYKFFPPIGTGPYILRDYDPSGYWFLWERGNF